MSNTDFQNRIARLSEKHTAMAEQMPARPEQPLPRAAMGRTDRLIAFEILAVPFFLLLGFATPIVARMIMFHYVSDDGYYDMSAGGIMGAFLGDIGIDMVLSGVVVAVLFIKNMWLPLGAHAVGGYVGMWREAELMRMFPDLWGMLYSPGYVADVLYFTDQAPLY